MNEGKSTAPDHMLHNCNHYVKFESPEILAKDYNWKRREIKEALHTSKNQHAYNKISHDLMMFK